MRNAKIAWEVTMKKSMLAGFAVLMSGTLALAQAPEAPEYELVCRVKAKEVAAEAYRGCVTEARTNQIDQLKKDYQEKLRTMKDEYERELKRLSSGAAALSTGSATPKKSSKKLATKAKSKSKATAQKGPVEEMSVELRPAKPARELQDEFQMDVPEPTPVEEVPTASNSF